MSAWKVEDGRLILKSGDRMGAGCHHKRGRVSACGGCYARLYVAIEEIRKKPECAVEIIEAVEAAMVAELKAPKKTEER